MKYTEECRMKIQHQWTKKLIMNYTDINGVELKVGDIIDIHQTVNGQNKFVIYRHKPLDIRYFCDPERKYEYDLEELLKPCKYTGEVEWEIVNNLSNLFK